MKKSPDEHSQEEKLDWFGFDLGTTHSCAFRIMKKKKKGSEPYVECLTSNDGPRVTPSIVHINNAGEFVVLTPEVMN